MAERKRNTKSDTEKSTAAGAKSDGEKSTAASKSASKRRSSGGASASASRSSSSRSASGSSSRGRSSGSSGRSSGSSGSSGSSSSSSSGGPSSRSSGGGGSSGSRNGSGANKLSAREAVQRVREELPELMGKPLEAILGVERNDDDGWQVTAQIVELARIPSSTDVLGVYTVTLEPDGELVGYKRRRRYNRSQADDD